MGNNNDINTLEHDLDLDTGGNYYGLTSNTLDNDLEFIEVGVSFVMDDDDRRTMEYFDQDFAAHTGGSDIDYDDNVIIADGDLDPAPRFIYDDALIEDLSERAKEYSNLNLDDIEMVLSTLFNGSPEMILDMRSITIDIERGIISFDSQSDLDADYADIDFNLNLDHCVMCGETYEKNPAEILARVSEEMGSIDEQINMLVNERTRLSYVRDDIIGEISNALDQVGDITD